MIYLMLAIIGCSGMSLLSKAAEDDKTPYYWLMCVNYLVASIFSFITMPNKKTLLQLPENIPIMPLITGHLSVGIGIV